MTYFAFSLSDILKFDETVANNMTMSEKLQNIAVTALGGFALVFVVLALIFIVLKLFSVVFSSKKEEAKAPEAVSAPAVVVNEELPEETVCDDGELVAAITAAICAFRSENGEKTGGFRVVSFRKK